MQIEGLSAVVFFFFFFFLVSPIYWFHYYETSFQVTWMVDGSQHRIDLIIFWCRSGYRDRSRILRE